MKKKNIKSINVFKKHPSNKITFSNWEVLVANILDPVISAKINIGDGDINPAVVELGVCMFSDEGRDESGGLQVMPAC